MPQDFAGVMVRPDGWRSNDLKKVMAAHLPSLEGCMPHRKAERFIQMPFIEETKSRERLLQVMERL